MRKRIRNRQEFEYYQSKGIRIFLCCERELVDYVFKIREVKSYDEFLKLSSVATRSQHGFRKSDEFYYLRTEDIKMKDIKK